MQVVQTSTDLIGPGDVDAPVPTRLFVLNALKERLEKTTAYDSAESHRGPFYHVRLEVAIGTPVEVKFDLDQSELESRIIEPYQNLQPIVLNGRTILIENLARLEIFASAVPSSSFPLVAYSARQGVRNWHIGESEIKDVTDQWVTTATATAIPQRTDAIELLCTRFHTVAKQLRSRHDGRSTLDIVDEYDVQDLLHALLRIFFDDVRPEEWTPSYAGKSSRMDFLLPEELLVVETKKTRPGLGAKEVASELIEDIARYRAHPSCQRLICFVYDPEGRIANPRGIENDLSRDENGFEVRVIIEPR